MTQDTLTLMKANFKESYVDLDEDQLYRIDQAKSVREFDAVAFNVVEEWNTKYFMEAEGMDRGDALRKAAMLRKKAGG